MDLIFKKLNFDFNLKAIRVLLFFKIEVQLIYNMVLVSSVQHSDWGFFADYIPM